MARTLDKVAIETFRDRVIFLSQQGNTNLRNWTTVEYKNSAAHNWERLGSATMTNKTRGVSTDSHTFDSETAWSRRVSVPVPKAVTDYTQREDLREVIIDPNGSYAIAHGMAARRAFDDVIITALGAAALDGDGATNALPAGQEIGDYTGELSFNMITEGLAKFHENDVPADFEKVGVIGPAQVRMLLSEEKATSQDYTALMALQNKGYVDDWLGVSWVCSNRPGLLPTGTTRDVWLMTKQAIGLQIKQDIYCNIEELPTHSYEWQVFTGMDIGAVRIEDEHVVRLKVLDSFTPA